MNPIQPKLSDALIGQGETSVKTRSSAAGAKRSRHADSDAPHAKEAKSPPARGKRTGGPAPGQPTHRKADAADTDGTESAAEAHALVAEQAEGQSFQDLLARQLQPEESVAAGASDPQAPAVEPDAAQGLVTESPWSLTRSDPSTAVPTGEPLGQVQVAARHGELAQVQTQQGVSLPTGGEAAAGNAPEAEAQATIATVPAEQPADAALLGQKVQAQTAAPEPLTADSQTGPSEANATTKAAGESQTPPPAAEQAAVEQTATALARAGVVAVNGQRPGRADPEPQAAPSSGATTPSTEALRQVRAKEQAAVQEPAPTTVGQTTAPRRQSFDRALAEPQGTATAGGEATAAAATTAGLATDRPPRPTTEPSLEAETAEASAPAASVSPAGSQAPQASAATPAPAATAGEVGDDSPIVGQLTQRLATAVRDGSVESEITLRLDPPELGRIRLTLHTDGDEVRGVLEASNPRTYTELQHQMPGLVDRLAEAGVPLRRLEIQFHPDHASATTSDSGDQAGASQQHGQDASGGQGGSGGPARAGEDTARVSALSSGWDIPATEVSDDSINLWI